MKPLILYIFLEPALKTPIKYKGHLVVECGFVVPYTPTSVKSITTPASLLANEFAFRSVLHGQVSLAAVNQMCVIHVAMN